MAKTDRPIIFHEPSFAFAEFDVSVFNDKLTSIRKAVDTELSKAERITRKIKEIQSSCPHPKEYVIKDPDSPSHQCLVCGYRRGRDFGS